MSQPALTETAPTIDGESLYELIGGEPKEKEVGANAILIASFLTTHMDWFARSQNLGRAVSEMLFCFADQLPQRRPDVAYVSFERWPRRRRVPDTNAWAVTPELAVEVVSPTNTFDEIVGKVREYFDAGVQRVWVISPPEQQVYVYHSAAKITVLSVHETLGDESLLPGFQLPLAELFDLEAVDE